MSMHSVRSKNHCFLCFDWAWLVIACHGDEVNTVVSRAVGTRGSVNTPKSWARLRANGG